MRCAYCVYNEDFKGKRNHGTNHMSLSTAYRAIDYLHQHSFKRDKVAISLYGGEPTLQFPLIQSCVSYANSLLKGKQIDLTITTNGILLTPEMAEFFCKHDFNVYVSIDGPEEINDSYRVDAKGGGSFQRAVQGLKYLVDAYGKLSNEKVGFSMVYTPPFSGKRIDRIAELWDELPWIPGGTNLNITYPTPGTILAEKVLKESLEEDKNLQLWSYERYRDKYTGKDESHPIADAIMEKAMAQLMQRPIFSEPLDQKFLNGCCIPGVRRVFVTADGRFRLCEKISSDAPLIGNINDGIDMDVIKKLYLGEYESMCAPVCSRCWAVNLCNSCFTEAFQDGRLDPKYMTNRCYNTKKTQERYLEYYCSLREYKPEGLNYLYKLKLS
ncbi:MAG: radical SAM protein, partial [Candidatus Aminicenantes bacterium]|nr:radical SAM protein [Candidatus Aminicenantes bacterium]NIM78271.1 radical SAM protein [Candidatus Aminicenantes bacterium]NIN19696.1 radical SAM protein [Candidatus Aminicenantes bacterium]NIN43578.1 radical SAM protein [Candidatus Aminicenantes bacterium]NIN86323.1 radical SAM protein [Candidatus Aminicenantes bacterium]